MLTYRLFNKNGKEVGIVMYTMGTTYKSGCTGEIWDSWEKFQKKHTDYILDTFIEWHNKNYYGQIVAINPMIISIL